MEGNMNYSVNIETVYQELPFAERFAAAKRDGFDFVELWDWTVKDLDEVAALCRENGAALVLIKAPTDSWRYPWHDEYEAKAIALAIAAPITPRPNPGMVI